MSYFKDKNILITGGTSGLGQQLAVQLMNLEARVAIIARTEVNVKNMQDTYPGLIGVVGDVASKEDVYPIAGDVNARLGDVDILFNVASYLGETPLRFLMDTECEDFEHVLQTNVLGPFRLSKAFVSQMLLKENGMIVNISSDAAVNAYKGWGGYSVSKAAVDHLSRILDAELKDHNVRCVSIDPGDMHTPMHLQAVPDVDISQLRDPADSATKIVDLLEKQNFEKVRIVI